MRTRGKLLSLLLVALLVGSKWYTEGSSAFPSRIAQLETLRSKVKGDGYQPLSMTESVWMPELTLYKDSCLYYIVAVSAEGGTEEYYRQQAKAGQRLVFIYDGQIFLKEQPRWTPVVAQSIYKLLRAARFDIDFPAVYAVRYDDICTVERSFAAATSVDFVGKLRKLWGEYILF